MRSLPSILLLFLCLTTGCAPMLAPQALVAFSSPRLSLLQKQAPSFQLSQPENRFIDLYPELRTATAPTWLRAATRVSYSLATATIARTADDPSASGSSIVQYDIIAKNRSSVTFRSTMINTQIQGTAPTALSYRTELPGVGEFWFSPDVLENAESAPAEALQVQRVPLIVEGVRYNVVRMQANSTTAQGSSEEVWAFDTVTGVLVFYRQALYGHDGSLSSGITMSQLAKRQVRLPWRAGVVPEWVDEGLEWRFAGTQTLDVGVGQPVALDHISVTRVTGVSSLWSEHFTQNYLHSNAAGSNTTPTGAMQIFGGYWLPARALTAIKQGAILDYDPLTGIEISVIEVSRQRIVLQAAGLGFLTQLYYNARDGRMIGLYQEEQTPNGALYTSLEAVN